MVAGDLIATFFYGMLAGVVFGGTWMSQEVTKRLVNGLQPTYKWGILGL